MPKSTCPTEATSNSEKIKPIALIVIELCLSEGISHLLSRKFCFIILQNYGNLLKAFWVDLKACLGLTNTASSLSGKSEAGFWLMFIYGLCPRFCGAYMIKPGWCLFEHSYKWG